MSSNGSWQFFPSTSVIINNYRVGLNGFYTKCKKKPSQIKSIIPFELIRWTSFQLVMICASLSPMDLYKYLVEIGFIDNTYASICKNCKGQLSIISFTNAIDGIIFKCNHTLFANGSKIKRKKCDKKYSIRTNSWFFGSHLTIFEILSLTYYWWHELPLNFIEHELSLAHGTPIDWANFCREVAEDIVINNSEKIGGVGVVVEIDESKFGKRKYNRGKRVDGVWVFGGVERETGKCFLVVVQNRTATTLLAVIKEWIKPGTTIISDCWKSYDNIQDHNDYKHLTVNHSVNFKDPITGAHTNQIEGLWNLAKKSLPETNRNKKMFAGYLASFMLHSKWKKEDGYSMFMNYAAKLYSKDEEDHNVKRAKKL